MLPTRSIPDLDEPLSDGVIVLRREHERDIPEILAAHDEDRGLHLLRGLQRAPSGAELGRGIEDAPARRAAGRDDTLTILTPPETFEGQVIVHTIDWQDRRADLGIWLRAGARGSGIGRRALRLASAWLFDVWGLERIGLSTSPENAAMAACATAVGFRHEGVLRAHRLLAGRREDEAVFSLLPGDLERGER